jgi:methyl-accepting chemotaxis protein
VADLQLHFKVQVQEWKNVLLRGKDEAARATSTGRPSPRKSRPSRPTRASCCRRCRPVNCARWASSSSPRTTAWPAAYQQGYAAFVAAQADAAVGDKAVRGIDRKPTELLDTLSTRAGRRPPRKAVQEARTTRDRAVVISLVGLAARAGRRRGGRA